MLIIGQLNYMIGPAISPSPATGPNFQIRCAATMAFIFVAAQKFKGEDAAVMLEIRLL